MSAVLVAEAIFVRLKADTGTGGLYSASGGTTWLTTILSGAYGYEGTPAQLVYPYIVFSVESGEHEPTFTGDGFNYTIRIQHYEQAQTGVDALRAGFNRIYGDAALQSSRSPSYGLHRHLLVLDTDSTKNPLGWVGAPVSAVSTAISMVDTNVVMCETVFETRANTP